MDKELRPFRETVVIFSVEGAGRFEQLMNSSTSCGSQAFKGNYIFLMTWEARRCLAGKNFYLTSSLELWISWPLGLSLPELS